MRRTNWIWVVLGMLLASCGGTGTDAEAVTTTAGASATTATSAATTTTDAPTTTAVETTTTTVPGCDDAEGIDALERIETHPMDVNGDGVDDQVTVFFEGPDLPHYGLLVEYASGGSARIDRPVYAVRQPLVPIGLYDINSDGIAEMFVVEYAAERGISYEPGASATKMIILQVGECSLSETGDQGGLVVGHWSATTTGNYAHCENDAITTYYFISETQDKTGFNVLMHAKTLENGVMVSNRVGDGPVPKQEMLDRALFDCGDLQLPAERPPA